MTRDASSMSWCWTASSVRSSVSTTMSSPARVRSSSVFSSSWNECLVELSAIVLAELAGHVLLGAVVVRVREDLLRRPDLHELAVQHERGPVRHARGLLHVVRDDRDRVALLELVDQLLDLERRDRVER